MAFFGLFICVVTLYIIYRKFLFVITGQVVNGELVGFKRGAKSMYGMQGFNYRIRIEYEGEIYIATSMESVVSSGGYPSEPMRGYFKVYFNPASPERVSIKGKVGIIWISFFLFLIGLVMLIAPFL